MKTPQKVIQEKNAELQLLINLKKHILKKREAKERREDFNSLRELI